MAGLAFLFFGDNIAYNRKKQSRRGGTEVEEEVSKDVNELPELWRSLARMYEDIGSDRGTTYAVALRKCAEQLAEALAQPK